MRVGEFSFDTLLHEGANAVVWAGVRTSDRAAVVAKRLRDSRRSLAAERRMLDKVAGPGIARALGVFDSASGPVLVQHRFGTSNLAEAMHGDRLPLPRALDIARQLAEICARIHGQRVIHRDIKPANILYDATSGAIALGDFGSAIELPVHARAVPAGDFVGTPAYASPEHTGRTRDGCDARSDLYSVGATLYELLTGAPPFTDRDLLDLVAAQLSRAPEPPNRRVPSIPPVVSDLVVKLLAKLPDERYQSARGLAADLERCLATLAHGDIPGFALGRSDLIRLPQPARLFGRDRELAALAQAFARAKTGQPTLMLISGHEGTGRSALVHALIRSVAGDCHAALGGWTAPSERPLSGLGEALCSLAGSLVSLDEDQLGHLRHGFAARVGRAGQVVLDVAPALGDVLGTQPPLTELTPEAARARLHHGLRCLTSAIGEAAPLVLALRGFEYADAATAGVIESILTSPMASRTLVVLIAREPAAFGALRDHRDTIAIELAPITAEALAAWTSAALGTERTATAALADVLHARTAGNPLMFVRLLDHLVETAVIERRDGAFTWSLDAVHAAPPPATLGALSAQRIAELPCESRRALAAVACSREPTEPAAIAAMLAIADASELAAVLTALERAGFVVSSASGYRVADPVISETALAAAGADNIAALRGRLGAHLLAHAGPAPTGDTALRIALALHKGTIDLAPADQLRAAELSALAGEHVMAATAYDIAATLFAHAAALLDGTGDAWQRHRELRFRIELAHARSLLMLNRNAEADGYLGALARRELSPGEIGLVYWTWCDNYTALMNRERVIELGLEGLARLGVRLPAQPRPLQPLAAMRFNQRLLRGLTIDDHLARPAATDERALAAVRLLSTMSPSAQYLRRGGLFIMICEMLVWLTLRHGHFDFTVAGLTMHACFSHAMKADYVDARRVYEVCVALSEARPAPHLAARTALALHYMVGPWFGGWHDSTRRLASGIQLGSEAGETVFAALCASASIIMLSLCGTPLDQLVATVEGWGPLLRGDGGVAANAANIVNLAGKMSRGEPVEQADLDRVTNVPVAAGPMRHNAMVNLALALVVIGHEAQVRAWHDEIGPTFPQVNMASPHAMTLWLWQGLFAIQDLAAGRAERRVDALRILDKFRMLRHETGATNNDPMIALLEAELARADGEIDRAAGLYARAIREARRRELHPIFAYANERWAVMFDQAGHPDDALLYYREAMAGYRRWAHLTKVAELERAHPALRAGEPTANATSSAPLRETIAINQQLDLVTVLKVSQDISTQLTGSGVVRAVLTGIAQNAGAERVVFVQRGPGGGEIVYGEVTAGAYRDLAIALDSYAELPKSVIRVVRRTGRPVIVDDAARDPGHAADPFVAASRARSIAAIPIRHKGSVSGVVTLENRLVAGAFTPPLISLVQALVGQAAISLDNASLYKDLEDRVAERTTQLHARNAELRMVLDHVAQGLVIAARDGRLLAERSAILASWFPDGMPATVAGLFADDPGGAAWFDIAWDQLVSGFLPLDLALHQMPRQLRRGGRVLAFDWQPILGADGQGGGDIERVLVVVSDVTAALRQAELERDHRQVMAMLESLSDDRTGAIEFLRDAAAAIAELATGTCPAEVDRRLIHTLKGNAAAFGLSALAARCHELEDAMAVDARGLTQAERAGLCADWQTLHDRLSRFIDVSGGTLQVRRNELDAALAALRRDGHPVANDLELWSLEPMQTRFQRIAEQARALADRLGKAPVDVAIDHGGVHLGGDTWAAFWSAFIHVVRNAIDHGLEPPDERTRAGKGPSRLSLRSQLLDNALVIELADDGRGIDWNRLRDKAAAAGLPTASHADLVAALFHDGISTRSEASETSGRGIGLGAIAQACRAIGAEITVDSRPGAGTLLRFELPGTHARVRLAR